MRLRTSMSLRQGRKVPRMLYEQQGPEPADDDPIVGLVDTPELAALIVAAVNGAAAEVCACGSTHPGGYECAQEAALPAGGEYAP